MFCRARAAFSISAAATTTSNIQTIRGHPESELPNKNGPTPNELTAIKTAKSGDNDHPSYSDSQLSDAMAARVINAIAASNDVWEHSAIVITYDESDGRYDLCPAANPELRTRRAADCARHSHSAPAHLALRARPRSLACRGRPQREYRNDQCAVRSAGFVEPAG